MNANKQQKCSDWLSYGEANFTNLKPSGQWCVSEYLTTSPEGLGGEGRLICDICKFPWYKWLISSSQCNINEQRIGEKSSFAQHSIVFPSETQ